MRKCPVMCAFNSKGVVVTIYCGQWQCEYCRKQLAKYWASVTVLGIRTLDGNARFWTLTLPPRYKTATQGYQAIPRMWDTLRKLMQREYGQWSYIAFVEGQPLRGFMPHFHVITMRPIPASFPRLKELALHLGFGYQAEDKPVSGKTASAYVAKYASKGTPGIPRGFRRVRASRDWPKPPDKDYDPYICQKYNELYSDYILRVHNITSVDVDTLHSRFQHALNKLTNKGAKSREDSH